MIKTITTLIFIYLIFLIVTLLNPVRVFAVTTIIGNLPDSPEGLSGWFLERSILVAGGIAFLLMIYGGFLFMTSAGDPNKLQEATDVIMSAIAGLLMIIFSVFLLRLIGVTFLGL